MYGLLVGFGLMFDKGQKQSSTLSCDSSYSENRLLLVNVLCLECGVNRGEYGSAKTKSLKC